MEIDFEELMFVFLADVSGLNGKIVTIKPG